MRLNWLHILNFKNWPEKELDFEPGINCLAGPNGRGKTNLLDAIYYLCFTRSFLNTTDSQNIRQQEPFCMLEGRFERQAVEEHVQLGLKRGQKKSLRRNKKEYEKLADHIGLLPAVMVCPQYGSIVTGSSEERRRWLDMLLSQFDHGYLHQLIQYQRVLQQRNALIKQMVESHRWDETSLEMYDAQLCNFGSAIYQKRQQFIREFQPVFNAHYEFITEGAEEVRIELISHLDQGEFETILLKNRAKDRGLQYTSAGIHKDDLDFVLNEMSIRKYGSQGQQKSFLMALKLAEHSFLYHKLGFSPILMLDDIFDKLDEQRVTRLISRISGEQFEQVFITDTGSARLQDLFTSLGVQAKFYQI